jgi:hypothetical protein
MKTFTLLAALTLMIGWSTDAQAMGYPHRLFAAKRVAKSASVAVRRTGSVPKAPERAWHFPGIGNFVRVVMN